jgi:sugar diacid utilization regulator
MLTEKEKSVIRALCDHGLRQSEAAQALFFHHNTIYYHRRQIQAKTGLDCCDFYDAVKLLAMCKESGDVV